MAETQDANADVLSPDPANGTHDFGGYDPAKKASFIPAGVLNARLVPHCEEVFSLLIPDAHSEGRSELRGHMPDGATVAMRLTGPKRGRWLNCHDFDQRGDVLDLVRHALKIDPRQAYAWALRYLGIGGSPCATAAPMQPTQYWPRQDMSQPEAPRRGKLYRDLYRNSHGKAEPIANYLAGRLGLSPDQLPGGAPRCLRFSPEFYYKKLVSPAMLAPVIDLTSGRHIATHVTFIRMLIDGVWRKALVPHPKITFGSWRGGVIQLRRGASGKSLREARAGETVLIAEGIENALAAALLRNDRPRVWAAVTVGNFKALRLPPQLGKAHLIIVQDNDEANGLLKRIKQETEDALIDQGHVVEWWAAPPPFKDMAQFVAERLPLFLRKPPDE